MLFFLEKYAEKLVNSNNTCNYWLKSTTGVEASIFKQLVKKTTHKDAISSFICFHSHVIL
ncbi:hypothetical protein SAMN04488600_106212 [Paenibacillus polymyxa]|nr:hypothetical protein SAMN04488600_106212 [Paenibacillus polymyxa]